MSRFRSCSNSKYKRFGGFVWKTTKAFEFIFILHAVITNYLWSVAVVFLPMGVLFDLTGARCCHLMEKLMNSEERNWSIPAPLAEAMRVERHHISKVILLRFSRPLQSCTTTVDVSSVYTNNDRMGQTGERHPPVPNRLLSRARLESFSETSRRPGGGNKRRAEGFCVSAGGLLFILLQRRRTEDLTSSEVSPAGQQSNKPFSSGVLTFWTRDLVNK